MEAAAAPERPTTGITPFLTIQDGRATEAVAFYTRAFAGVPVERNATPDGRLMQASLKVNGGWVMLSDSFAEPGAAAGPQGGMVLHLQVEDADAWFGRAIAAGCTVVVPLADQFWGDRYGQLRDPFGHGWSIGSPLRR